MENKLAHPNHPAGPRSPRKARALEREERALNLRKLGFTYPQIAQELDISVGGAFQCVSRALGRLQDEVHESAQELRQMELDRLDHMFFRLAPRIRSGDTDAIRTALRVMERRAKLLGLDTPEKHEHSGLDGRAIPLKLIDEILEQAEAEGG